MIITSKDQEAAEQVIQRYVNCWLEQNGSDSEEYADAFKMFFSNCVLNSYPIADLSAGNLSRLEIEAAIKGDSIAEFIFHEARLHRDQSKLPETTQKI